MEKNYVEYWDNNYTKHFSREITYDNWLDNYKDIIESCNSTILDLGCGAGNDTLYLIERNKNVLSCDYSQIALDKVKQNIEGANTMLLDISNLPYPFKDNTFEVIIADLTLHYFYEDTTFAIFKEIRRILTPNGVLLARVNAVSDTNFGAGNGTLLEENYYHVNGYNKRFFNKKDILKFFSIIGDVTFNEGLISRFGKPKSLFEIKVINKK